MMRKVLQRIGITLDDLDFIEMNEAFATISNIHKIKNFLKQRHFLA